MRIVDITELREMLDYDPETGLLTWKVRPVHHFKSAGFCNHWNKTHAGKITNCVDFSGRVIVNIKGRPHYAHRLIWAIVYGEYVQYIDHIDLNPSNNKLSNLRACTKSQNQHNRGLSKNNSSGFKGVSWHSQRKKWTARITVNWKNIYLGLYDTQEEAHAAYCKAADELHADFANHGVSYV